MFEQGTFQNLFLVISKGLLEKNMKGILQQLQIDYQIGPNFHNGC